MEKFRKKVNTPKRYQKFCQMLVERLKQNQAISENPMLDGMIIGLILTTKFSQDLFLDKEMGNVLDGTIQKLEQIAIWVCENEEKLLELV
jgi:hypothetical protein